MLFPLFLVAIGGGVSAQLLARQVPQNITERAVRASGGVGIIPDKFCSNDLLSCDTIYCCPTSLTCSGYFGPGGVCCPEGKQLSLSHLSPRSSTYFFCAICRYTNMVESAGQACVTAMQTAPYCAEDTWTLWDETQGGINLKGYFCCAEGLVGLLGGKCVDPTTVSSPTLEAMEMAPGGAPLTSAVATSTAVEVSHTGTTIAKTVTDITTSTSASTATTAVVVSGSGNSSVSTPKISTTKAVSSLSSVVSGVSTAANTPSSVSGSASATATKSSDGNTYKTFGYGSIGLLQAALAVFVGAAL